MSVVELKQVGPIESIKIDLPEGTGGVKVFRGVSGAGKTTALKALSGLMGDKDALSGLTPHDGCERGEVTGLGRSVKIGQRVSTGGALAVPHLSRVDISTLVDPRVIQPAARTKARVRCLVTLGGKTVTPKELLGEHYESYASDIDLDEIASAEDPVEMADKIKRAIDTRALERSREAERYQGMAIAKRQEAGDIDQLAASLPYAEAVDQHANALQARANAEKQRSAFEAGMAKTAEIEKQLGEFGEPPDMDAIEKKIELAEQAIVFARARLAEAETAMSNSKHERASAEQQIKALSALQASKPVLCEPVSEDQIAALQQAEVEALERLKIASDIDRRRAALAEAKQLQQKSVDVSEQSLKDRQIASEVQSRVQSALPEGPIKVKDGELVVVHGKRKKPIPIDDLSTGERWRVALEYAVAAVGEGGVVPVAQESWQALSPDLKQEIAEACKQRKVWLVSAEVCDGPLRVGDFDE
jgi:energy-coupling factor transporter ATP-binding protein EcfA2